MTSAEMWVLVRGGDFEPSTLAAFSDLLEAEGGDGDLIRALRHLARTGTRPRGAGWPLCVWGWLNSSLEIKEPSIAHLSVDVMAYEFAERRMRGLVDQKLQTLYRLAWALREREGADDVGGDVETGRER